MLLGAARARSRCSCGRRGPRAGGRSASTRAVPDGAVSSKRRYSSSSRRRHGARAVLADLQHADQVGVEQAPSARPPAQREASPRTSRLGGLEGEAVERTVLVSRVSVAVRSGSVPSRKGVAPVIGVRRGTLRKYWTAQQAPGFSAQKSSNCSASDPRAAPGRSWRCRPCSGASAPPSVVPSGVVCGCVSGVVPDVSGAGGGLRVARRRGCSVGVGVGGRRSSRARGLRRCPGTSERRGVARDLLDGDGGSAAAGESERRAR